MERLRRIDLSPPQVLAIGYSFLIMIGTFLLQLPIAVKTEEKLPFIDALFTATSATAITGLVVVNTGETFTLFGQTVIMILFQIGALSFMTITTLYALILGKSITLKERMILQSALNQMTYSGIVRLTLSIVAFTMIIQAIAAVILFIRWLPDMGANQAAYYAVFHAISGFANAGFDLFENSLQAFTGDLTVNLVITSLFVIGGLGFYVVLDLVNKRNIRKLSLHSKVVLTFTAILAFVGILTIFLFEYTNPATLGDLTLKEKILAAYFQGLTPRSAGFSTIEIGDMAAPSLLVTMVLMIIGGGPGGTAGGIKITTFAAVILVVYALVKGRSDVGVFKRRIPRHIIYKSIAVIAISFVGASIVTMLLLFTENAPFEVILFEAISGFFTVGLSAGLTPDLSPIGKLIITLSMFIGRLGPMTIAFALSLRLHKSTVKYVEEDITVG